MQEEETFSISISNRTFPGKLWKLVNDSQFSSIYWDPSGEGILIHQQQFEAEVLFSQSDQHFKTKDFTSFIRQLNIYGFRKVRLDPVIADMHLPSASVKMQPHHFQNPNFKRDNPEFLFQMKRHTSVGKGKHASKCFQKTENASVSIGHQGKPYQYLCNDHLQEKTFGNVPKSTHELVMSLDGFQGTLSDNNVVLFSAMHCSPMDSPQAHTANITHMQQGLMPQLSAHNYFTSGFNCHNATSMNTKGPVYEHPAAPCSRCGHYPNLSGSVNPIEAGDGPDSKKTGMSLNMDTDLKWSLEMQAVADSKETKEAIRHLSRQFE